jgi:peptidoglycan-associated lipoprotein
MVDHTIIKPRAVAQGARASKKEKSMTRPRIPSHLTVSMLAGLAAAVGCAHDKPAPPPTPAAVAAPAPVAHKSAPPAPAATPATPATPAVADTSVYFDFDSALLRDDARSSLKTFATAVEKEGRSGLVIEGNCDELGTVEYNLALGEQRARSAKDYLGHLGVPADRIHTLSYGSQHPKYPGHDDAARAKNRRDDIRVQ